MMEGEVSLVAGRSQREKRRSYKDLLREEEIIDAEVRKSSKKRPKESDGFVASGEFHKKKKKHHDDYHYKDHHKKKKRPSDSHGSSTSASAPSSSPHDGMTAMGLLQAITSPTAVGSEPCPTLPKKPSYPSLPSVKDRRRESMPPSKPAKKKPHVMREMLPMVGEEVELEGHYGGSYELLDDESSSSAEDEEGGQLVIDDSFNQYRKKNKKSKKSKKKKDKEKERRHSSKSNGSSDPGGLYAGGRSGSHSDKKRKKEEKARLKAVKAKKKVLTAYQIFSKEYRLSILEEQPGLDFGDLSKKLADAWKQLPEGDKQVWRERAEYLQHKQMKYESTTSKHSKHSQPKPAKDTSKTKGVAQFPGVVTPTPAATQTVAVVPKRPEPAVTLPQNGPSLAPAAEPSPSPLRDPEVDPIDAAAHLQLLGESLSLIGRRLQETEGMVTVSGSLSVLLDSVLCALGPLACLTAQVPELNGCPPHVLSNTLDNIAYVMPGL
ncbi:HMG box-containing protein 4-like isoform X1 [Ictalurus furcatus]|uniref:HMG box-containing protein 4-like isoform X1 n=2 Tax=Ictalurus furcatus TaxID=66913 RepID=UPI00235053C2|nr:HMG box-containing protein 4-like isoform X1 [Ictalurus furcatus]